MRIITGSTGTTHVTSNDDGEFNQGIFGTELIVFANGGKLEASIVDNNTIRISDGDLLMQGRHALIEPNTTEDVSIDTGAVGVNRNDLIVARYALDTNTGYESIVLAVVKGTESAGDATDPEYTTGDIRTGSVLVEVPLYRVRINGITISSIDKLFAASKSLFCKVTDLEERVNAEIEELKKSVSDGKTLVAEAITEKGIETATDATFATMAANISNIPVGASSYHASHMEIKDYEGGSSGTWVGTMTNNGVSLEANSTYIVIATYHQTIEDGSAAGANYHCDWDSITFPSGSTATLLHEDKDDGVGLFRVYKVDTANTAGVVTAVVEASGYYRKHGMLEVCALH